MVGTVNKFSILYNTFVLIPEVHICRDSLYYIVEFAINQTGFDHTSKQDGDGHSYLKAYSDTPLEWAYFFSFQAIISSQIFDFIISMGKDG